MIIGDWCPVFRKKCMVPCDWHFKMNRELCEMKESIKNEQETKINS